MEVPVLHDSDQESGFWKFNWYIRVPKKDIIPWTDCTSLKASLFPVKAVKRWQNSYNRIWAESDHEMQRKKVFLVKNFIKSHENHMIFPEASVKMIEISTNWILDMGTHDDTAKLRPNMMIILTPENQDFGGNPYWNGRFGLVYVGIYGIYFKLTYVHEYWSMTRPQDMKNYLRGF